VSSVVDYTRKLLKKHYGRSITPSVVKRESVLPPPIELPPAQRLFGFPIKKFSKRLNANENRVLCLTAENLCICDGATVLSVHPLNTILHVSIYEEDCNKFSITYSKSSKTSPSIFFCDERDTILANLMNICGSNTADGPVFDLSGTHREYYIPDSCLSTPDPDIEEYFLRKLARLNVKSADLVPVLKEFLLFMPQSYSFQTKDRRGIAHMFEMLQFLNQMYEKGNEQCASVIIDILSVIQRLLSSRINFSEAKGIKNGAQTFSDLLRSQEDRIVAAAALTLLRIIEVPKAFSKELKSEAANKAFYLSTEDKVSPILNALLSTLIQHAGQSVSDLERRHNLSISCLLDILVSQLNSRSNTTDKAWFRDVVLKMSRGRVMITLFELARSPCFAIALKTTIILKVIFTQISTEQLLTAQNTARQQLSLLFQIFQAVNSRLKQQRNESAELVGLMAEGNEESMRLISRIFPPGLVHVLETKEPEKKKESGIERRRRILRNVQSSDTSRTKKNWIGFFKALSRDIRTPTTLWNADTRNEVIKAISEEIDLYERDKENNQDTNKIWNHEEFSVHYDTLERELIIFDTYLGVILEQPDQLTLSDPATYLYQCFHKLIMETNDENRIRYLNVMAWCYRNYATQIGVVSCYPNLIQLLKDYIANNSLAVAGALLEFILSSFKDNRNIRRFIDLNGVETAAEVLRDTHCPNTSAETVVCLNVLLGASSHVSSTDERGCIKIPIPRAKRDLSNPKFLTRLVYTLVASSDLVIEFTARLLTQVLDKNSGKAKTLHKHTGVLFFIFAYQNTSAGPALMRLLQVLSAQQDPHLIRKFIPDTVASYLQSVDAEEFANVFYCITNSPEVIWTKTMLDMLQSNVQNHIQGFLSALQQDPYATYTFQEMDTIEYPGLDQELRCGNYYIRNVIENPEWNIENVEEVLQDALELASHTERVNQILLIRACSVLFKKKRYRRKEAIKNFEGFPLILRLVNLDRDRPDLSSENLELLNVSCELIFYSVWTSDENLTNFLKLKGLSRLCNLLWCCSRNVNECYSILTFVLKIVCRLLPSPITRDQVALNTDIIRDILSCLTVGQPFEIVSLAMQCLIELSQEDRLAQAVFKNGGHFYLLDFILSFNPSAAGDAELEKLNQLSVSACLVLGNISGIYKPQNEPLTSTEEKLQSALAQLLTKGNLERMRQQSEFQFIGGLTEAYESPVSIWNESTRNELASFIRSRIQAHQHSQQEEPDTLSFTFSAHQQELQIDGIFLRYYIQNPSWRLQNARSFVCKLLAEIEGSTQQTEKLTLILQSLYFVLTETQGLEKLIVSSEALDQFFVLLSASETTLQSLVLNIFLHATANQACVDAICASNRLPQFVSFLRNGELEQRRILLEVVSNMVSCSARAVEGITTSGLILYLLHYVVSSSDEQLCGQSLGVLKQTKSSSGLDTRFSDATKLFLPAYLVATLDRPANFLHIFSKEIRSPNIVWDSKCRSAVQQHVSSTLSNFQSSNSKEWNYSSVQRLNFEELCGQTIVGGVYLDLYLDRPEARLHNPASFIDECMSTFSSSSDNQLQSKLLLALSNLLTHYSPWAHYIAKQTPQHLQTLLSYFNNTSMDEQALAALLKIIVILAHVPACRKKFHQTSIIAQLLGSLEGHPNFEELVIRTVYLLVKKETAFIKQVLDAQGLPTILQVLDKKGSAAKYAVALIKSMVVDRKYDSHVRQLLAGREQILQDRSKLPQPEWVSILALTPSVQTPYIEPVEADARAQQVASLQRSNTSIQLQVSTPSTAGVPSQKIAPLERATTQPAITHKPQHVAHPQAAEAPAKSTPVPPAKPAELRQQPLPEAIPDASAPVPPVPFDAPPPPPPAAPSAPPPAKRPAASAGRGALLDSIVAGKKLKHVKAPTEEERKNRRNVASPSSGGGDNLMSALAGALAQRRTAMITDLAANPFADEQDDDDSEEWD